MLFSTFSACRIKYLFEKEKTKKKNLSNRYAGTKYSRGVSFAVFVSAVNVNGRIHTRDGLSV